MDLPHRSRQPLLLRQRLRLLCVRCQRPVQQCAVGVTRAILSSLLLLWRLRRPHKLLFCVGLVGFVGLVVLQFANVPLLDGSRFVHWVAPPHRIHRAGGGGPGGVAGGGGGTSFVPHQASNEDFRPRVLFEGRLAAKTTATAAAAVHTATTAAGSAIGSVVHDSASETPETDHRASVPTGPAPRRLQHIAAAAESESESEAGTGGQHQLAQCRNTVQGRQVLTDDHGYQCTRRQLDPDRPGCCMTSDFTALPRHSCHGCDLQYKCCPSFEVCVSCCLAPQHRDLIDEVAQRGARKHLVYATVTSAFDMCLFRCRTSSASTVHENSYRSHLHHCFGGLCPPVEHSWFSHYYWAAGHDADTLRAAAAATAADSSAAAPAAPAATASHKESWPNYSPSLEAITAKPVQSDPYIKPKPEWLEGLVDVAPQPAAASSSP